MFSNYQFKETNQTVSDIGQLEEEQVEEYKEDNNKSEGNDTKQKISLIIPKFQPSDDQPIPFMKKISKGVKNSISIKKTRAKSV
tara:strand:+ start:99 stop:350 length:252 start_codon:yes stop_codon:yes gene_type:complete